MASRPHPSPIPHRFPVHCNPHPPERTCGTDRPRPMLRLAACRPDYVAFRAAWRSLRDADHFGALCRRHGLEPLQALRHAPVGFAAQLPHGAREPLTRLVAHGVPMRFDPGGRHGAPAWHGLVERLQADDDGLLLQARGFRLRLSESRIGSTWRFAIPDTEGLRESLAFFDLRGRPLVSIGPAPGCGPHERWIFGRLLRHALASGPEY
jgi:putative heme degradation protein